MRDCWLRHRRGMTTEIAYSARQTGPRRAASRSCRRYELRKRRRTTHCKEAGQTSTRVINKIKHVLRRHNLQVGQPTERFPTKLGIAWLTGLVLPEIDRLEMN